MDTSSPLLTTPEVADLFSCAEKTVRKMAADGHVELDVEVKDDAACLRYCDTGIAFDPVSNAPDDDRQLAARERRVGGLGWPLIKDLSTDLEYQRLDGQNQITLKLLL